MAKKKKEEDSLDNKKSSLQVLDDFVSSLEGIYDYQDEDFFDGYSDTIIPTDSERLNIYLDGGIRPGIIIAFGDEECGKTAFGLSLAASWQEHWGDKAVVIYADAEGRLTKYKLNGSKLDITKNFRVIKTNVAETIFSIIKKACDNNPEGYRYFFVIDSLDAILKKEDWVKTFDDAPKVAGGASMQSLALKKLSLPIHSSGHLLYLISQVRSASIGGPPTAPKPSGGNAPRFYSDLTMRFKKGWTETHIKDDEGKIIGNRTLITFTKSHNEVSGGDFTLPVKRNHKGGIWKEYDAYLMGLEYGIIKKAGSWFSFSDHIANSLPDQSLNFKVQGESKLLALLENNPSIAKFITQTTKELVQ